MRPRAALRPVLLTAAALLPAAGVAAQDARVALHHGFPLAGGTLTIVVDGLQPGSDTALLLSNPLAAPVSVFEELSLSSSPQFRVSNAAAADAGVLTSVWRADERGRILLEIALDDARDVDRDLQLRAQTYDGQTSELLHLHVQPPTLVLAAGDGFARLSLLDGRALAPSIPGQGGLHGVSFSADGVHGYALRDGGVLQELAARDWAGPPLSSHVFDAASDLLAGGASGAAFLLARPAGTPFPDAARALFLDNRTLRLEPMAQAVGGRRVALSDDGLTAFVAEDDLVVRELDLLAREPRALLSVGLPGDSAVADLLLDGRQLLVATRGASGRSGTLTVLGLDDGVLGTLSLASDPARLVALGAGRVLVVPAAGGVLEVFDHGLPARSVIVPGTVLDAVTLRLQPLPPAVPDVTRLVGAPAGVPGVVILLGDPTGAVHVWHPDRAALETVPGLRVEPGAAFSQLP